MARIFVGDLNIDSLNIPSIRFIERKTLVESCFKSHILLCNYPRIIQFLEERIEKINNKTHPNYEILITLHKRVGKLYLQVVCTLGRYQMPPYNKINMNDLLNGIEHYLYASLIIITKKQLENTKSARIILEDLRTELNNLNDIIANDKLTPIIMETISFIENLRDIKTMNTDNFTDIHQKIHDYRAHARSKSTSK